MISAQLLIELICLGKNTKITYKIITVLDVTVWDDFKEPTYPFKSICIRVVLVWGLCLGELMILWPMWRDDDRSLTDEFAIAREITAINKLPDMQKDGLLCSDIAVPNVVLFSWLVLLFCSEIKRQNHSCIKSLFFIHCNGHCVLSTSLLSGVQSALLSRLHEWHERKRCKNFQPIRIVYGEGSQSEHWLRERDAG